MPARKANACRTALESLLDRAGIPWEMAVDTDSIRTVEATALADLAIYAMLDDPLIEAFGFPRPSRAMRWLMPAALKLRGRLAGLLPPRARPRLRTEMTRPSYPDGYEIETVGPGDT